MAKSTSIKKTKASNPPKIKTKKPKTSGGSGSRYTRQGFRSEYIVKYIFSAFGTAVDVSAENDLGIDLFCNLVTFDNKLIIFKSTYGIQVKSKGKPFEYRGTQATKWLSTLEFPILLVEVDKANSLIKIFSTWNLNLYIIGLHTEDENQYPKKILFDTNDYGELPPPDCKNGTIPVGKPIIEFHYSEIGKEDRCSLFHEILTEWLDMDHTNYRLRRAGVSRVYGFPNWETNQKPSDLPDWTLKYVYSPFHNKKINKLLVHALTVTGNYNKESSNGGLIDSFKDNYNDLREYVMKYLWNDMEDYEKSVFNDPL